MLSWTIRSVLAWSEDYLRKHQIASPKREAELLLGHSLSCSRVELYLRYEQPLQTTELAGFRELLKRRARREPTQYILGSQEFWSLPFKVDGRVLIPRPETECLVERAAALIPAGEVMQVADICTGSGAIACAMATEHPQISIWASDISPDALALAKENIEALNLQDRIALCESDLFARAGERRFDLILSNPPYIRSDEMEGLQAEVREFEPHLALEAGEDGLRFVRRLLEEAPAFLKPAGWMLIEIGAGQGAAALALAQERPAYGSAAILQDYARLDRILIVQSASL